MQNGRNRVQNYKRGWQCCGSTQLHCGTGSGSSFLSQRGSRSGSREPNHWGSKQIRFRILVRLYLNLSRLKTPFERLEIRFICFFCQCPCSWIRIRIRYRSKINADLYGFGSIKLWIRKKSFSSDEGERSGGRVCYLSREFPRQRPAPSWRTGGRTRPSPTPAISHPSPPPLTEGVSSKPDAFLGKIVSAAFYLCINWFRHFYIRTQGTAASSATHFATITLEHLPQNRVQWERGVFWRRSQEPSTATPETDSPEKV